MMSLFRKLIKRKNPALERDFLAELKHETPFQAKLQASMDSVPANATWKELAVAILVAEKFVDILRKRYVDERNRVRE